jgi:hypothetical protein
VVPQPAATANDTRFAASKSHRFIGFRSSSGSVAALNHPFTSAAFKRTYSERGAFDMPRAVKACKRCAAHHNKQDGGKLRACRRHAKFSDAL